jgi:O-antigen ligase
MPLALLIIITISRVHQYFGFLNKVRPALLLFLWAGALLLMGAKQAATVNWREKPMRLMLYLGLAACVSAPFGISLGGSASFILNDYWKVIVTALMIAAAVRNEDDLWTLVWSYVIAVGILSWMTLTVFHMETGANGFSRLGDGYTYDANDIGLVCMTGLPLCLVAFRTSQRNGKIGALAVLALTCVAIARTGSRGAFLGLLAVAAALLVFGSGISVMKRVMIAVVGAAALSIAAPPGYLKQMGTIADPTQDYNWTSRTGRKEVALRGFGYLQRNPITGIGVMNFSRAEGTLSDAAADFASGNGEGVKWSAAHNSYLQAVVELGVVGGLLFLALLISGIIVGRSLKQIAATAPPDRPKSVLLAAVGSYLPIAFIGFAVPAFFLSFAYMDPVYILAAFAAGALGLAHRQAARRPSVAPTQRARLKLARA